MAYFGRKKTFYIPKKCTLKIQAQGKNHRDKSEQLYSEMHVSSES